MPLINRPRSKNGNLVFRVSTAPTEEPITVAEVKEYARIDYSADDTLIATFIQGVREAAEAWLGMAFMPQTITANMDYIGSYELTLPRPPLISVTAINAIDEDGTRTAMSTDGYYVTDDKNPGVIVFTGNDFPETDRDKHGYEVIYQAGYADAASVPAGLRIGLMAWVLDSYENRVIDREPPREAISFMSKFRRLRVFI